MNIQIMNFLGIIKSALSRAEYEPLNPDWEQLYSYARQHQLLPIFYEGCQNLFEFFSCPEKLRQKFYWESVNIISEQVLRTQAFFKVYEKLLAAGIKPILLMGAVCGYTYGILADHRISSEEDIYIQREDFTRCKEILYDCGFQMKEPSRNDELLSMVSAISFVDVQKGLKLEVHFELVGADILQRKLNHYFADAYTSCISQEMNGQTIHTLNHTLHFIYLFLHYYSHFAAKGARINQLIDLLMYGKAYHDTIYWEVVEAAVNDISANNLYADVIEAGRSYLGLDLSLIRKVNRVESLIEEMMQTGFLERTMKDQARNRHQLLPILKALRFIKLSYDTEKINAAGILTMLKMDRRRSYLLRRYGMSELMKEFM